MLPPFISAEIPEFPKKISPPALSPVLFLISPPFITNVVSPVTPIPPTPTVINIYQ